MTEELEPPSFFDSSDEEELDQIIFNGNAATDTLESHGEETELSKAKPVKVPTLNLPHQMEKIKKCIDYVNEHPEDEETMNALFHLFRQLKELLQLHGGLNVKQKHPKDDKEPSSHLTTHPHAQQDFLTVGLVVLSGHLDVQQQFSDLVSKSLSALPFNDSAHKSKKDPAEPTAEGDNHDIGEVSEMNDAGSLQQASPVSIENESVNSSSSAHSQDVPHVELNVNSPSCFYCVTTKGRTVAPSAHFCLDCDEHICDPCKGRHLRRKGMEDHHVIENSNRNNAVLEPIVCFYRCVRLLMKRFFGADPVCPSNLFLCQECLTIHNKRSKHIHEHSTEPLVGTILVSWKPEANIEELMEKLTERNEILLSDQEFIDLLCQHDLALLAQVACDIHKEKLKLIEKIVP